MDTHSTREEKNLGGRRVEVGAGFALRLHSCYPAFA